MTDDQIRDLLKQIDSSEAECSEWEGNFLETVLFERPKVALSEKQRQAAFNMIEKYGDYIE